MKIATSDEIRAIAGVDTRKCGSTDELQVHLEMPLLLRMCRALSKRRKTCQTDRGSSSFRDPSERRELSFSG